MTPQDQERAVEMARKDAQALICEFSDPPLCRVCGEPLSFGSSENGGKYAHYVRNADGKLWDQEAMDHTARSTQYGWKHRADIVRVARAFLASRAELEDARLMLRHAITTQPANTELFKYMTHDTAHLALIWWEDGINGKRIELDDDGTGYPVLTPAARAALRGETK